MAIGPIAQKLAQMVTMLGSSQDGDVLAAARAIERILKKNGDDFHTLADYIRKAQTVAPPPPPPPPPQRGTQPFDFRHFSEANPFRAADYDEFEDKPNPERRQQHHKSKHEFTVHINPEKVHPWANKASFCFLRTAHLPPNDAKFIRDIILTQPHDRPLSRKRNVWLEDIHARLKAKGL